MSTRSKQQLKRRPTDGHLGGLKFRRKQKTLERRKSNALRRWRIKECKKALRGWWAEEFDNGILNFLKGE